MNRRAFLIVSAASVLVPGFAAVPPLSRLRLERGRLMLPEAAVAAHQVRAAIDTGAAISSVSESFANELRLETRGRVRVNTVHGRTRRPFARAPLQLSGGEIDPARVLVIPTDWQDGFDYVLAGGDVARFALDFQSGQLTARGPSQGHGTALDWRNEDAIPTCRVLVGATDLALIIDSGAVYNTLAYEIGEALVRSGAARPQWYDTVSHGVVLRKVRIAALSSGSATFENAVFFALPAGARLRTSGGAVAGTIGTDLMANGNWSFDYPDQRVTADIFRRPGEAAFEAGVDIRTDDGDPGRVTGLAIGGPAQEAGLRLGDRIVSYGGAAPAATAAFEAVGDRDRQERIPVELERNGAFTRVVIETRRGV